MLVQVALALQLFRDADAHSLISLQVNPFPLNPELQAHKNDPMVLVQVAFVLQL